MGILSLPAGLHSTGQGCIVLDMSTQTETRITLINAASGAVHGHRAGCADIAREARKAFAGAPWTFPVASKAEAWLNYNSDFLDECEHDECDVAGGHCQNAYDIDWKPCADHVPVS